MDLTALIRVVDNQMADDAFALQLATAQWHRLASGMERLALAAGDLLIRCGERQGRAYLIEAGHLQVFVSGGPQRSHRIATLGPGTIVGEGGLFTEAPRMASVEAMTPCVVWALMADRLEVLARDEPALVLAVLRAAGAMLAVRMQAHLERGLPII